MKVTVEHCLPLLVGHLVNDTVVGVAGVVDDDVEGLELVDGCFDQAVGKFLVGHRADTTDRFATGFADRLGGLFRYVGVQVVDDHARSVTGEQLGHSAPDPPSRAGDDGDFSFDEFHCDSSQVNGVPLRSGAVDTGQCEATALFALIVEVFDRSEVFGPVRTHRHYPSSGRPAYAYACQAERM
jgi:hypothetical protein